MSYESAFSLEKKKYYTAFTANQAYHDQILKNYDQFCCSEFCDYPLLCVNFEKKSTTWKVAPYFKAKKKGLPHDCKTPTDVNYSSSGTEEGEHSVKHDTSTIKLNITLDSGFQEPEPKQTVTIDPPQSDTDQKPTKKSGPSERTERINSNTLSSLISYYLSSEWDNSIPNIRLLDGSLISFNQLFQNIDKKRLISSHPKVYYGLARISEESTYFLVKFNTFCLLNGVRSKPSILIHKSHLTKMKVLLHRLERLSLSNELFTLFFYGNMKIEKDQYIQFDVNTHSKKFLPNLYFKQ